MYRYLLLFILIAAAPALAQTELSMPNCTEMPVPTDSIKRLIAVRIKPVDPNSKVPHQFLDGLAKIIAQHLLISKDPHLRVLSHVAYGTDSAAPNNNQTGISGRWFAAPVLDASIYFTLSRDGEISNVVKANVSSSFEIMSSMMQAMQDAFYGNSGAIVLPPEVKDKSVALELRIDTFSDSTKALGDSLQKRWQPAHWIRLPVYEMSKAVRVLSQANPIYPMNALYRGTEGKVTIVMSVNEEGKVIPGAVNVTEAKYMDFLRAVLKTVPEMRFEPAALANGCAVPLEVSQPFMFSMK